VVAAAVVVAVLATRDDDDTPTKPRAQTQTQEKKQEQPQNTQPPETQTQEQPPAQTAPDNEDETGPGPSDSDEAPSALNDQGFEKLKGGDPEGAIPLLERAVQGFEEQGDNADPTTYGFALYNLGMAYLQAGRAADAIALFERRLQVNPDDRPNVVEKALKEAQKQAGQKPGNGGFEGDGR
jgi:tetratricopeptide (TPR) repeat protein